MTSTGTPTPKKVSDLATEKADLSSTALIGIFGSDATPGALIREGGGKISRVEVGDQVAGGVVAAIGQGTLVLSSRRGNKVLRLPQGRVEEKPVEAATSAAAPAEGEEG